MGLKSVPSSFDGRENGCNHRFGNVGFMGGPCMQNGGDPQRLFYATWGT